MKKVLIEGRNMFDPIEMEKLGYIYISIGRGIREEEH
ncbi:hypothetical protein DET59_11258 [Rossellomorea aquimaris]|uniref:Uncharacterized protein n=1 Tax=Rossellomorea aquimaris TaxID=189382 RepID=A0A366EK50_9BACI|nr:hypothetical protein DET59_11258 [Rossellomorea aquimaris]